MKRKWRRDDDIIATGTETLFRFNDGKTYAPAKTLIVIRQFEPNLPKTQDDIANYKLGTPPWVMSIAMHGTPAASYKLMIVNGDRDGSNRVTSAKIDVDGVSIVLPTEVNQNLETLTRTIQLQKESMIKVAVDGPANSHVYVVVE